MHGPLLMRLIFLMTLFDHVYQLNLYVDITQEIRVAHYVRNENSDVSAESAWYDRFDADCNLDRFLSLVPSLRRRKLTTLSVTLPRLTVHQTPGRARVSQR